jgi:cell division protein FtsZ
MIFLTCGLGGGTGTGAAPVVAELARRMGILTVGIVTLPFSMEGHVRMRNAIEGLNNLRNYVDTLLIIPNDKMLEVIPNLSIPIAFKMLDEVLVNAVKGTIELITTPGLVNLDFADVKAVMKNGGLAMIGSGESNSSTRAVESVTKALSDPFLPVDITGAEGALINIIGGPDVTLSEANEIVRVVSDRLEPESRIVWGAKIDGNLKDKVKTMVIITGVKETEVYGQINLGAPSKKERLEKMFDVRFLEK